MDVDKIRGKIIFEIIHWPFKMQLPAPTALPIRLTLLMQISSAIIFPETCFAYNISKPEFIVCVRR